MDIGFWTSRRRNHDVIGFGGDDVPQMWTLDSAGFSDIWIMFK